MRIRVEIGIDQVGELAGAAVDLDDVGAFDFAEVGAAAAFVDAQERFTTPLFPQADLPQWSA
jgi:hypothetical protein